VLSCNKTLSIFDFKESQLIKNNYYLPYLFIITHPAHNIINPKYIMGCPARCIDYVPRAHNLKMLLPFCQSSRFSSH
jgi:hypothetical protein